MTGMLVTGGAGFIGTNFVHAVNTAEPAKAFEAALQDTVQWYLDNQPWWEAIMARKA